jgi:CheY-like chemotaxis protein
VESDTGSSRSPEGAAALHRLRSTLARLKAELELAEADGTSPPIERLLEDLDEAFGWLSAAEGADRPATSVLIVDDDNRLAEVTARGLRRLGFDARASATLEELRPGEVLIIDLGLIEGLDESQMEEVRAARPIIVTGATDRASRALGDSVDASGYLVKPVELDALSGAIKRRGRS